MQPPLPLTAGSHTKARTCCGAGGVRGEGSHMVVSPCSLVNPIVILLAPQPTQPPSLLISSTVGPGGPPVVTSWSPLHGVQTAAPAKGSNTLFFPWHQWGSSPFTPAASHPCDPAARVPPPVPTSTPTPAPMHPLPPCHLPRLRYAAPGLQILRICRILDSVKFNAERTACKHYILVGKMFSM